MDFIKNGRAHGNVAVTLMNNGFDVNGLRPWIGKDDRHYVAQYDRNAEKIISVPVHNATATLRKDEWKILDEAIIMTAKERLSLVGDLRASGLTYTIPNGMGKTVLETETVSDITEARVSMDPAAQSDQDRPEYELTNLPLPVIHKDFYFNARQVATSRDKGAAIDTTTAELAARRVAEEAEKLALGISSSYTYGGGTIYGLTNYPDRLTATITDPASSGWTPEDTVADVLAMKQQSIAAFHYGPWKLYTSTNWEQYLDRDYSAQKGDNTLRDRLKSINNIQDVRQADFLTGTQMILVQQTRDVIREVIGMDITTVQWSTMGGMQLHFKVMAILVPQLRSDHNGNTGIVHGSI